MNAEIVGTIVLVAVFGLSMWRNINMGAVALVAAFLLGTFYLGMDAGTISAQFPGNLLVTLVGVTLFFGLARANGTIQHVVDAGVRLTRGNAALLPWVFFMLAAIITGSGALSAATNTILIPVAMAFAARYRISPLLMGLSILNGTNAGGFSPIAVYYSIVAGVLEKQGIVLDALPIFIGTFVVNLLLNVIAFFLLGGRRLFSRKADSSGLEGQPHDHETGRWGLPNTITLLLFAAILTLGLFAKLDVGFLAITAAVILAALYPAHLSEGMKSIGWGVVLLIGGIVTYIGVLQKAGVVDNLAAGITGIGAPLLAALLIMYVAGIVSAFASTNAMFGILVPIAAPLLLTGSLPVTGFVLALCIAASAVDSSPFSTGGALVVANTEPELQKRTFTGLMIWGMTMVATIPLVVWAVFLVL